MGSSDARTASRPPSRGAVARDVAGAGAAQQGLRPADAGTCPQDLKHQRSSSPLRSASIPSESASFAVSSPVDRRLGEQTPAEATRGRPRRTRAAAPRWAWPVSSESPTSGRATPNRAELNAPAPSLNEPSPSISWWSVVHLLVRLYGRPHLLQGSWLRARRRPAAPALRGVSHSSAPDPGGPPARRGALREFW